MKIIENRRTETRKHFTQMTKEEIDLITEKIKNSVNNDVKTVKILPHAYNHFFRRTPKTQSYRRLICHALLDFNVIEYKKIYNDVNLVEERSVIRGVDILNGESIVIVYSITHRCIVTLWVNSKEDTHKTLDFSLYDKNMEIK